MAHKSTIKLPDNYFLLTYSVKYDAIRPISVQFVLLYTRKTGAHISLAECCDTPNSFNTCYISD